MPAALILALGGLPLLVTLALLLRYRFEAQVALRYLQRRAPPGRRPKVALAVSLALMAAGAALLATRAAGLPIFVGAVLLFVGGFAALGAALLLRFSVFTTASALGLALGVAALMVVLAVTGGFRRDFLERVTAFHGHVVVGLYGEPSVDEARAEIATLRAKLTDLPGLVGTGAFAVSFAEVSIGAASANLKALDLSAGTPPLARWMVEGDLSALARPARCGDVVGTPAPRDPAAREAWMQQGFVGHLILGRPLANRLHARVGDCLQIVVPFGRPGQLAPVALSFQLVGIFEMGFHTHDTRLGYVALDDLRALETARPFIYGLELTFADPLDVDRVMPIIEARMGEGFRVLDWRFLSQGLFASLESQRVIIGLFLCIIVVVSAFNLLASLIIMVITRTREIAVLGALGARRWAVLRVFVLAGAVTGLVGLSAGVLAGGGICALLRGYHFRLDVTVYMIAELPVELRAVDVMLVASLAQLASLLATIPAVWRALRLTVTEGLRQV